MKTPTSTLASTRQSSFAYFAIGLVAVLLVVGACLWKYGSSVFFYFDGASYMASANALLHHPVGFYYTANFLQSFGNIYWPINFAWLPEFRFAFFGGFVRPLPAYLMIGLFIYLASFAMVRAFDFGPGVALAGALAIELLTMPLHYPALLNQYYSWTGPNWLPIVYTFQALIAAFGWTGRGPPLRSATCVAFIVAASVWTVGALTKISFVIAVGALPFGLALFIVADGWRERLWKAAAVFLTLAVLAFGPIDFMRGMFAYTTNGLLLPNVEAGAAGNFGQLLSGLVDAQFWTQLSLVSQVSGWSILIAGPAAAILLATMRGPPRRVRAFGCATLAALVMSVPFFYGIVLIAAVEVALVICVVAAVGHLHRRVAPVLAWPRIRGRAVLDWPAPAGAALAVSLCGIVIVAMAWHSHRPSAIPYPPREPPLMRRLASDIAFEPGDEFRGRLLNFAVREPYPDPRQNTLAYLAVNSALILAARTGNDFSYVGPAYFGVPTAQEQNRLATPADVAFIGMALTEPGSLQVPDHRLISRLNPAMLAAAGISRVLMDSTSEAPSSFEPVADDPSAKLRLYRVKDANVGNYAPVDVVVAPDAASAAETLGSTGFNPRRSIIVQNPIDGPLVPAAGARLVRTPDGFRFAAQSPGRSVLLLPFEYTRCMRIEVLSGDLHARLMRADIMFTGLEFSGSVDAKISIRFGPFTRPRCRLEDAHDTAAWGLAYKPFLAVRARHPDLFDFAHYN